MGEWRNGYRFSSNFYNVIDALVTLQRTVLLVVLMSDVEESDDQKRLPVLWG